MVRKKDSGSATSAVDKSGNRQRSNVQRSAYFARREAAKVLRCVLQGDARRRAVGSIKSLVYSPSVRNKKGTFALVCQTLKYLLVIKEVCEATGIFSKKWKKQEELIYVIMYDILFGQAVSLTGDVEKFLIRQKDDLELALAKILVKKKVNSIEQLMALYEAPDVSKPCYVRVNTLRIDVSSAARELGEQYVVEKDDMVPHLLKLPPNSDLHEHRLVKTGSIFLQGKASSMVAAALEPEPGWEVLDACSAPGNKTVHLAALMKGQGKIIACELNEGRIRRLEDTIRLSGATNIEVLHGDFLTLDPKDSAYSKIRAILLDPSCSGSGTATARLDHLLPSHVAANGSASIDEPERLHKLAAFQTKALTHALSFPAVEKIIYSTCSIHQIENEDVVQSVLPLAESYGFQLLKPFPKWQRRGLPVFEGASNLLRTDPVDDKEGFFIALFRRPNIPGSSKKFSNGRNKSPIGCHGSKRSISGGIRSAGVQRLHTGLFRKWMYRRRSWRRMTPKISDN